MTLVPWWQLVISITGWSMLAGGMVVLVWALIGRRRRDQPCCPRCRYDMSGTPSVVIDGAPRWRCPECGRGIASICHMHRRQRRRGWAMFALLLMVGGYGAMVTHRCGVEGPRGLIPTLGLTLAVRVVPIADAAPRRWWQAPRDWRVPSILIDRIDRVMTPAWQRRAVLYAALGRARADLTRSPPSIPHAIESLVDTSLRSLPGIKEATATDPIVTVWLETAPVARVGTPVVAEVKCEGLGVRTVHVEVRSPWRDGLAHATAETTAGVFVRVMSLFSMGTAQERTVNLGTPATEGIGVEVEMTVRRSDSLTTRATDEPVVAVYRTRLPIRVVPRTELSLTPVEGTLWFEHHRRPTVNRKPHDWLEWTLRIAEPAVPDRTDVTVGARIEIALDDVVYFTGRIAAWPGQPYKRYEWGYLDSSMRFPHWSVDLHQQLALPPTVATSTNWRLRLIGDEDVAFQNPNATHYWRGVVDLPVMFDLDSPVDLPREP